VAASRFTPSVLREMLDHHVAAGRIDATQRDKIKAKCGL
jgi:hypothetical protein